MSSIWRYRYLLASLAIMATCIGCYTSQYALDTEEHAKFDQAFVGDWQVEGGDQNNPQKLIIRNLDYKHYYVELDHPGDKPMRMSGYITKVKNVPFANLHELTTDGTIPDAFYITRIELLNGKVSVRQLDDKFFKDKKIESSEDLRKLIGDNLENPAMYDKDGSFTAVKAES
jgi:hypothetical protein